MIKRHDIVTAVGSSGCGKSTAIHFVALQLHRQNGYDIVPASTPEEVRQYYDPECKQVFVIDDLWGKSTKDICLVNSWERLSNDIEIILKSRAVKILSSCRTNLCKDLFKNLTFLSNSTCDLSLDYCLTNGETIEIASTFLNEAEVNVKAESNSYGNFDYFPLLCLLHFSRKPVEILDFVNNPVQFIKNDFKLLLNTKNSKTIATLMLFVVYNNDLNANVLLETVFEKRILKKIADNFCLETPFSSEDVRYELNSLKHSYVKQHRNSYSMCHDKVFEIFLSFLCENKLNLVLNLAHTYVIRDRFLFESLRENETDQHVIDHVNIIPETNEKVYFSRLLRDIIDGFIANVLLNRQNKHLTFRQRLVHLITGRVGIQKNLQKLSTDEIYELLSSTISQGYCEFVTLLLLDHVDINHCIPFMGTPLYIAIGKGHINIVKLLLYKKADTKIQYFDRTPLFLAVEKRHLDIIRLLLHHKADPNIASLEGTPLYRAVEHGYADIVELLLDNKAKPNIKHTNGIPDFVVTRDGLIVSKRNSGNEEFIISCGTPLHKAVENHNMALVKLLLDHNADPNIIGFRGTPLYIAAELGLIDIVKLLLRFKAHPDFFSNSLFKATPLFRAAEKGYIDIVKILLDHNADPFIPYNKETPLTIAKSNGYSDIGKLVLYNSFKRRFSPFWMCMFIIMNYL